MSSSLIAINGSSQLPTETTTAANTPDSYSVTLNKEYMTESQINQGTSDSSSALVLIFKVVYVPICVA